MFQSLTPPHSLTTSSVGRSTGCYSVAVPHSSPPPPPPLCRGQNAYVDIIEQPASVGARFRYKCEGRSAGCIRGASSTEKRKTFPTIKLCGYQGTAVVVVSCVTVDGPPYYPHPHNLVGKQTCKNGVCSMVINSPDMTCSFSNLGIQCVKKKDIKESLMQRQALQVDPFGTGFSHYSQPNKINLNALRLCFQVFIKDSNGTFTIPLAPVISDSIFDNKTVSDLTICKLSHYSSPVTGGQEVILLCDQVNKDDIQVMFYEEHDGEVVWSSNGGFAPHHVHRKAAICFVTPSYRNLTVQHPVEAFVQLRRPSDGAVGKPKKFTFLPLKRDPEGMLRKKHKFESLRLGALFDSNPSLQREEGGSIGVPRLIKHAVRKKTKENICISENFQRTAVSPDKYKPLETVADNRSQSNCQPKLFSDSHNTMEQHLAESRLLSAVCSSPAKELSSAAMHSASSHIGGTSVQDILAIATKQIGLNSASEQIVPFSMNAISENAAADDALEKFDSLDLGFDPSELDVNDVHLSDMNFDSVPEEGAVNFTSEAMTGKVSLENTHLSLLPDCT